MIEYRVVDGKVVSSGDTTTAHDPDEDTVWEDFVGRFGITTAVGLLAVVAANAVAHNLGFTVGFTATMLQLLLIVVVVGCMAVLAVRSHH